MPAERAPMRKVREVLRLRHALGVSERQIAITTGVSRSTVGEYLRRAAVIGITWPVPEGLDNAELERRSANTPAHLGAVLGASNYTYAEARWSEGLADWIGAHVNALNMIGGVPKPMRLAADTA